MFLLILIILIVGVMIFYPAGIDYILDSGDGVKGSGGDGDSDGSNGDGGSTLSGSGDESDDSLNDGSGGSSGGGSEGVGGVDEELDLSFIEESSCGLYFDEYGVCEGVCDVGVCVSEGRSCYCRR